MCPTRRPSRPASPEIDWSDLRVFLALVRSGSISRAAVSLGVSLSTASRRLSALEEQLGRPLFARTPAGLEPTAAAHALRPHAEAVEKAAVAGLSAVGALDPTPSGPVRVTLPSDMVLLVVLPRMQPFLDTFPDVTVLFDVTESLRDLTRREADIAIRVQPTTEGEELVTKRLRDVPLAPYATRSLVERYGIPDDPGDLPWVGWIPELSRHPEGLWVDSVVGTGRNQPGFGVRVSNPVMVRHAVASSLGAGLLPELFAGVMPDLVRLPYPPPDPYRLYMTTHRAIRHSPRVAVVWELMDQLLSARDVAVDQGELRRAVRAAYGFGPLTGPPQT